jgi:hypothetical protein
VSKTMLFNPYTGRPRNPLDIQSDPEGILMLDPDEPIHAALAAAPQEPVAWLREDGTACITARTKESLIADGGAAATSMKPYCVPCYTHPPRPAAQPPELAPVGMVIDPNSNIIRSAPAAQPSAEPTTECTTCGATVVRVTGVYDYPPPGEELVRAARDAINSLNRARYEMRGLTPTQDITESIDALRRALDAGEAPEAKGGGR